MTLHRSPLILFVLLIITSCTRSKLNVDIDDIEVPALSLQRLDQDLFKLNEADFEKQSETLKTKYGKYYDHYLMGFISRDGTNDPAYKQSVLAFVTDRDIKTAQNYVQKIYPDKVLNELITDIEDCSRRFRYHFPSRPLPTRLVTCLSGWNYAFAYMDSALVLSLDMYLGDTAIFYDMLQYPYYQQRKLNQHYILPDLARGWLLTEFDKYPAENTLLQHTVFYGKLYYAVNALLPTTHDSLLIGYTGEQLSYCKQYEKKLWGYFAEKNRLYQNDLTTVRELTSEGPFTSAISKDCPPRIAMWVGWQIVKNYMDKNEEVTLQDLMQEQDAQKVLSKSRYRP